MKRRHAVAAATTLMWSPTFLFAQGHGHGSSSASAAGLQTDWGIAGQPKSAARTVRISMTDDMRFTPDKLQLKQGDVVRFIVVNDGKLLHEFVLGTKPVLDKLADLVAKSSQEVDHARADRLHVEPGQTGELTWNFNRAGTFWFACLFPGHYQAGMIGSINVAKAATNS